MAKMTRCRRCRRTLTDPKSVAAGIGPKCARRRAAEARAAVVIAKHKPTQVDRAIELIGDGGIVATSAGTFAVVSSSGTDRYTTTSINCTCAAGAYGRTCYHRVAAELMLAAG